LQPAGRLPGGRAPHLFEAAPAVEPDLRPTEVGAAPPCEGSAPGWPAEAADIDLEEAGRRGRTRGERRETGGSAVGDTQRVVDVRAMAVVGGDQHAPTVPQRRLQAR